MSSLMKWNSVGFLLKRAAASFMKLNGNHYGYQYKWTTDYNDSTDDKYRPSDSGFSLSNPELGEFPWKINHSDLDISVINAGEIKLNPNSKEFIPQSKHKSQSLNLNPRAYEFIPQSKQSHDHFESQRKKPLVLDPSAKEFNPQSRQRYDIVMLHKSQSPNLNPRAYEFIPQSKQCHEHFESRKRKPLILDPSAKEFNPQCRQRCDIVMLNKSQSLNLNPRAYEFIPKSKQCHDHFEFHKTKPLILDPSAKEFNPQSKQRCDIVMLRKSQSLNLNPRAYEFIPQSKQCHDHFEFHTTKPLILDPSAKEFNPQSKQRCDIVMLRKSQSLNLNPRAYEFIPQSKQCHDHFEFHTTKPLILDPSAKEFNPLSRQRFDIVMLHKSQSLNLNPRADAFIPKPKQKHLDLDCSKVAAKATESFHHLCRNNTKRRPGKSFLMRLEECIEHATEDNTNSSDYSHQDQQTMKFQTLNPFASPFKPPVRNGTRNSEEDIQNVEQSTESQLTMFWVLNPFANPFVPLQRDESSSSLTTEKSSDYLQQKRSGADTLTLTIRELLRKRPDRFSQAPKECIKRLYDITEHFEKDNSKMDGFSKQSQLCESLNPSAKEFFPQSDKRSTGASNLGDAHPKIDQPCAVSNKDTTTAEHGTLNPNAEPFISQTSVLHREAEMDSYVYNKDNNSALDSRTTAVTETAPTISESSSQSYINEDTPKSDFRRTPRRQYQGPLRREYADDLPEINGPYSPSQYECLRILRNLPFLKHDEILDALKQQSNVLNEGLNLQEKPENGQ